jgi:transporter family protein
VVAGILSGRQWSVVDGQFAKEIPVTAQSTWWVFALLSAVFAALTTIFAKIGVTQVNSNLATAIRTIVILVIAWGIVFMRGEHVQMASIGRRTLLFLVLSGVATGLSWLCYFRALQLGKASAVAPVDKSSVVFILILSALFLGEALTWKSLLGTLLIVVGTILFIL